MRSPNDPGSRMNRLPPFDRGVRSLDGQRHRAGCLSLTGPANRTLPVPRRRSAAFIAACLLTSAAASFALAPTAARPSTGDGSSAYESTPRSADGIGKRYMGREIAGVMGWQGAAWLERQEREREERTDLLLAALELRPGMVVGDIGAGTGYLSRRMAAAVAPGGRVVAEDVQPEMIDLLARASARERIGNIQPALGSETDIGLPAACLDLAIMVDVYHELAWPREVLGSIVRALKPGARLVFVEYRAEDAAVPIKSLHKMSEAQVRREAEVLPLSWERTIETLPWQHIVVFRRSR